jgi:hypothetical protein
MRQIGILPWMPEHCAPQRIDSSTDASAVED